MSILDRIYFFTKDFINDYMRKIFAIIGALITGGIGIATVSTAQTASAAVN